MSKKNIPMVMREITYDKKKMEQMISIGEEATKTVQVITHAKIEHVIDDEMRDSMRKALKEMREIINRT